MASSTITGSARAALAMLCTVAGCASPQLDAQWVDPNLAPGALHGARVLVACEAYEVVIEQLCQDQLAAEVTARGGTPVIDTQPLPPTAARPIPDDQRLPEARRQGAQALLAGTVRQVSAPPDSGVSIGIGGFSWGRGGGAGVGVSAPLPIGGRSATGYALDSRISDVASGRLLWSAKATTGPSGDAQAQIGELARRLFESADKARLF
jgi:hypothetical protein